jgi:uncharacterized protein
VDCRGADNQLEFDRQWPKTVEAILGMDVDVLGVIEIENDGYGPDSAIQDLVNRLNDATAPGTYAFIDADAATGEINALGTDAIKVGLLYRPANVTPVGITAVLNTEAFVNGGDAARATGPLSPRPLSKTQPAPASSSTSTTSRARAAPAMRPIRRRPGQLRRVVRTNAVLELMDWLYTDPTGTGETDILIIGDLNSYAKEDPIQAILEFGFVNLAEAFIGPQSYSYVFDGQWGNLDYALASPSLAAQVTGVAEWHINADEPNVLDYNTNFKSANQIEICTRPISSAPQTMTRGRGSVVERLLAKEKATGSNPVARSGFSNGRHYCLPFLVWRRGQVVRQGSAKPSFTGSNPVVASKKWSPRAGAFFISRLCQRILTNKRIAGRRMH